jgi:segregation and condensation protein B
MDDRDLLRVVEALLFVSDKPLTVETIAAVVDGEEPARIADALQRLQAMCEEQERGVRATEVAGGWQLTSHPDCAPWLKRLYRQAYAERLSLPSLETLSIIAYRQPISRPDIEAVRGVNVDGVIRTLLDKRLIRIAGRKEAPGRPILYGTTREFLQYFGLNALEELPRLDEVRPPHDIGASPTTSGSGRSADPAPAEPARGTDG